MAILRASDSVRYLRGVGPARADELAELGIATVADLLNYFPRDLAHQPAREPIAACRRRIGQTVTVAGVLERGRWSGRPWKPIFTARLADDSGWIEVVWFNAGWLKDKLVEGDRVVMTGKLRRGRGGPQLANPKFVLQRDDRLDEQQAERWEPVYPAGGRVTSRQIRGIVRRNLPRLLRLVEEPFPPAYLRRHELPDRWQAVAWMHLPTMETRRAKSDGPEAAGEDEPVAVQAGLGREEIAARLRSAGRRLAWDEAFLFQLGLALRRRARRTHLRAAPLPCDERIRRRILERFPFDLTAAQGRAIDEIAADMARPVPMNRLLQGDVGSGKTVVALFAALLAVAHRRQAAIMAPTEILADQHHDRISRYLSGSRVRWAVLTGSLPAAERRRVHRQLADGELDLVVGTTALLSEGVRFARLAMVVIDEQHKFGVYQRSGLREKVGAGTGRPGAAGELAGRDEPGPPGDRAGQDELGPVGEWAGRDEPGRIGRGEPGRIGRGEPGRIGRGEPGGGSAAGGAAAMAGGYPHTLVMTATPIPRSLALTVFGDLSVSIIDELPPGCGRVDTRVVGPADSEAAMAFIATRLAGGGQAYVVCPRIGAADAEDGGDLWAAGPEAAGDGRPVVTAEKAAGDGRPVVTAEKASGDERPVVTAEKASGDERPVVTAEKAAGDERPVVTAEKAYRELRPRFERFGVALLHGQMEGAEQRRALADFAGGRVRVLVATTVVEVGVDVSRANVMAVLGSERFGLAQLHQLRGRIGRVGGAARSYCLLFTEDAKSTERLRIMEQTNDGFRIAEEDLARRGPGQFFGTAQHGLPEFRHIDLVKDLPLLRQVRQDAFALVESDPTLSAPKHAVLRRHLLATHGEALDLIDAG